MTLLPICRHCEGTDRVDAKGRCIWCRCLCGRSKERNRPSCRTCRGEAPALELSSITMSVAPWRSRERCPSCRVRKPTPGLCYTCSTGRPRTVFRGDERHREAVA